MGIEMKNLLLREETDPTGNESGVPEEPKENQKGKEDGDDRLMERHWPEVFVLFFQQFPNQQRIFHFTRVFTRSVNNRLIIE